MKEVTLSIEGRRGKSTSLFFKFCPQCNTSNAKWAMNVVRFLYKAQYLLVLDRHMMCPVPMEEIGRKGIAKLCRVPTAGVIIS